MPLYDPLEGKALHNGIRYKPTTKEQCVSLLSRAWKTVGILMDSTWFKVVLPQRVCSRNTVRYHISRNSTYNGPYMSEDPVKAFRFFLRVLLRSPPPKNQATAGTSNASARPTLPVPVQATASTAASSSVVQPTPEQMDVDAPAPVPRTDEPVQPQPRVPADVPIDDRAHYIGDDQLALGSLFRLLLADLKYKQDQVQETTGSISAAWCTLSLDVFKNMDIERAVPLPPATGADGFSYAYEMATSLKLVLRQLQLVAIYITRIHGARRKLLTPGTTYMLCGLISMPVAPLLLKRTGISPVW